MVLTVGGFGGAAYAANGAAPGDTFYGLDRALEAVGIGNGGSAERLAEVKELVDHGQTAGGLEHAADIVEEMSAPRRLFSPLPSESGLSMKSRLTRAWPLS